MDRPSGSYRISLILLWEGGSAPPIGFGPIHLIYPGPTQTVAGVRLVSLGRTGHNDVARFLGQGKLYSSFCKSLVGTLDAHLVYGSFLGIVAESKRVMIVNEVVVQR